MVEHIQDLDDPRVAEYRHVGDPALIRRQGLLVAEGRLVVQRLLGQPRFRVRSILLTPTTHQALREVLPGDVQVFIADQTVVRGITGLDFHRGCLAIAERPPDLAVPALTRCRRLLALEGVGNPDNMGGLFRVAAAFAVGGVVLDPTSVDPYYRKAVRTSMGSTLSLAFARDPAWPAALDLLRADGFRILALTPRPSAVPLKMVSVRPDDRLVVMAGAEGAGLSDGALARADMLVRIPIASTVDSLNVTVATGIALAALSEI